MSRVLFAKEYYHEDLLNDLRDDMSDMFEDSDLYHRLPEDEDGYKRGTFHVSIIWKDE